MNSQLLNTLYQEYDIANLSFGVVHDKLGDVYEDFCVIVLCDAGILQQLKSCSSITTLELHVMHEILVTNNVTNFEKIASIKATKKIPHRSTRGSAKTDIIATINMMDGDVYTLPISCKQSTVNKVALAEFGVNTICREMRIDDARLEALLLQHQTDCSAKNFTAQEKAELTALMEPIARSFVRWVLTGSPDSDKNDVCIPTSFIKFSLAKPKNRYNICISSGDFALVDFKVATIEEYITHIMCKNNGTPKSGGFGTGLSWTYATGSKGVKMQFKG